MSNINQQIEMATERACGLLRLSREEVFWLQIEAADMWLKAWIGPYPEDVAVMKETPEFWLWWRQQWAAVDREIVSRVTKLTAAEMVRRGQALERYAMMHEKARSYRPNSVVMESFHREVVKRKVGPSGTLEPARGKLRI
jgi:hypothetical protein